MNVADRAPADRRRVIRHLETARGPLRRVRGLLGRRALGPDEGLLLRPCRRVHTFGMRFPIDVLLCDDELRVIAVETLRPWRTSSRVRGVRCCVELPAGTAGAARVEPGARLEVVGTELRFAERPS